MIVYRVTQSDENGEYINFPWAFCTKCGRDIGSRFIPDWLFCPWCGHKFKRSHKEIAFEKLMKMIRRVDEEAWTIP